MKQITSSNLVYDLLSYQMAFIMPEELFFKQLFMKGKYTVIKLVYQILIVRIYRILVCCCWLFWKVTSLLLVGLIWITSLENVV